MFIDTAKKLLDSGKKVLVVMRRRELVKQTQKSFKKFTGSGGGVIMPGHKDNDMKNPLQIGSIDTLIGRIKKQEYQFLKDFDYVFVDECFPKNTYIKTDVGNKTIGHIEKMKKKPRAMSFNEETKKWEYKQILNVFKNSKKDELVEIRCGLSKIRCTKNHKIRTVEGYKAAHEIVPGNAILTNEKSSRNITIMNSIQEKVFVGSFFGDGGVHRVNKNTFRLRVRHDLESQGDYCESKANVFNAKTRIQRNRGYSDNLQREFGTISYYINTDNLFEWCLSRLCPVSLAIFFQDDGSITVKNKSVRIHTENFTEEQNEKIRDALKNKFGIKTKINKYKDGKYCYLYVNAESHTLLFSTIKNYIHKDCAYKVPIKTRDLIKPVTSKPMYCNLVTKKENVKIDPQNMYDLEVEDNHNYIVSGNKQFKAGLLVHNCHDTTSPKYQTFLNEFKDKVWLGYTATCFPVGKKYLEDAGWEKVVKTIESSWLRDNGFLVKDIVYAPSKIDVSGIKTRGGDYDQKSLAERASSSSVTGDLVKTYQDYGESRPALLFAVNKDHANICAEAFRQAGIPAISQNESHSSEERDNAVASLENGDIKILCSVGIFSTGTDIPKASCLIMARPTKSEILFVQQIGRGLRPYKKCARCKNDCGAEAECFRCGCDQFTDIKNDCIILDHANNCERFGMAYDKREPKLSRPTETKKKAEIVEDIPKTKTCSACFAVYEFNQLQCPYCDHVNEVKKRMIEHEEGELRRVTADNLNISRLKTTLNKYLQKELRFNLKESFKYFKLYEEHGEIIFDYSKELGLPSWLKGIIQKKVQQGSIKRSSN